MSRIFSLSCSFSTQIVHLTLSEKGIFENAKMNPWMCQASHPASFPTMTILTNSWQMNKSILLPLHSCTFHYPLQKYMLAFLRCFASLISNCKSHFKASFSCLNTMIATMCIQSASSKTRDIISDGMWRKKAIILTVLEIQQGQKHTEKLCSHYIWILHS